MNNARLSSVRPGSYPMRCNGSWLRAAGLLVVLAAILIAHASPAEARNLSFQKRLEAQRAIEQVYWSHRIWPGENPGAKPPLSQVLPEQQLRARVENYLKQSNVLETIGSRPITHDDLHAEMDRMAANSRAPGVLRELFAALGNDGELIAETLVRQSVAEGRIRMVHESVERSQAEPMRAAQAASNTSFEAWWAERSEGVAAEVKQPAGRYEVASPASSPTDMWTPTSTGTNVPETRYWHSAVWTGAEMIVWGGAGGFLGWNTGGRYNPATDAWLPTSTGANVPLALNQHTAVWTGTEMIVWGGFNAGGQAENTGGRYSPTGDTWQPTSVGANVPSARAKHTAVWTGTEMIIWGGNGENTGGRYNPGTNSWALTSTGTDCPSGRSAHAAVWTGAQMIVWGGVSGGVNQNTGGRYDPVANTWTSTSTGLNVAGSRHSHTAVWTGTEMIVWGGIDGVDLNTGGRYNPSSNSWTGVSTGTNVPSARSVHAVVWTGGEMIVWGGTAGGGHQNTGGRYDPSGNVWSVTSTGANVPSPRRDHTAVWTGTEMIVWGGRPLFGSGNNTGGHYGCPSTDFVYRDADGDGYGDSNGALARCDFGGSPPPGYSNLDTDCDDADATIHPGAPDQTCNGIDENCNGSVDDLACVCKENGPGLAGWWRGNGTTNDELSAANFGIPVGGATYAPGRVGQAFSLDGIDDYVAGLGDAFTFAFLENTGVFTINAWINLADINAPVQQAISASASSSAEKGHFFLWENTGGEQKLRLALMKFSSGVPVIESSSPNQVITTPGWHHVAAVGNGSTVTFYVDGVVYAGTGVMGSKPAGPSTRAPDIGRCPPNLQCMYNGLIDELQFYDRALSAAEVRAIYNAGGNGMCGTGCAQSISGLVGWWPLSGDGNDRSPSGNHADVSFASSAPGKVGQAISLNGTNQYVGNLGSASSYSFIENTGVFTIDAWIKLSDPNAAAQQAITGNIASTGSKGHYFMFYNVGGEQRLRVLVAKGVANDPVIHSFSPDHLITDTNWHHVAAVGDGTAITFYVDGVRYTGNDSQQGSKGNGPSTRAVDVGRCPNAPVSECYFNGQIDEVQIFSRALSTSEIQTIHAAGSSGMCGLGLVVGVDDPPVREDSFALAAPWPNPAVHMANLSFRLPEAAEVRADVFDVVGRRVASILQGERLAAGEHRIAWDGRDASGQRVRAGIYQVRLLALGAVQARSIVWMGN